MKNIFTVEEIEIGMFIIRNDACKPFRVLSSYNEKDLNFSRTVTFKIGFSYDSEMIYGLSSVLTDGLYVGVAKTLKELAEHLNNNKFGYRPLTKEELHFLIDSSNQGFY